MGRSYVGIAGIHRAFGKFASAEEQCAKALAILDPHLAENPHDERLQDSVADAHLALAQWLGAPRGTDQFARAVAILEPRARHDRAAQGKLASAYDSTGYVKGGFGLDDPIGYCNRAISLLEPLARDEPIKYDHNLARSLFNMGLAEGRSGRLESSVKNYRRCLQLWDAIPADLLTEADREGVSTCQDARGLSLDPQSSPQQQDEAERILRQAIESFRVLARRHPRLLRHRARLSQAWSNLGSFYWKAQRWPEAETTYLSAVRSNQENFHDFPEDPATRLWLAHCLQNLADTQGRLQKTKEAREGFEKALAVIDPLTSQLPHEFGVLQCVGIICLNYGNMVKLLSGPAAALALEERCVRAFEEANRIMPSDAEVRQCLLGARGNLCTTLEDLKKHDEALAQIEATLPICNPKERVNQRFLRGLIQARAGRHEPAAAEARSLAKEPGLDAETLYNLACILSLSAAAARADTQLSGARQNELATTYSHDAIGLIDRSLSEGKFPKKELLYQLSKDTDMDPIRASAEFKELLDGLRR
jgi:tetratricopeptide (TPR) repeat protein